MYTLGINAAFHDPAAVLIADGRIVAAAEEERFTRIKHGKRPTPFSTYELPFHAIDYCLREMGGVLSDIDHIAYSFDPSTLLGRHVDGTARIQTVNAAQHPTYHALLEAFAARTGVPVLVNTSFNTRGEPVVCTPRDALESFWTSPLDALVIGSFLVRKPEAGA